MAVSLTKYPQEVRLYYFEFGTYSGPASGRDVVFGVLGSGEFAAGENFGPTLLLPLLVSLVSSSATPTFNVTRSDGQASDLTLGTAFFVSQSSTRVGVKVTGGTAGLTYTITCLGVSSQGNTVAVQGVLNVSNTLP